MEEIMERLSRLESEVQMLKHQKSSHDDIDTLLDEPTEMKHEPEVVISCSSSNMEGGAFSLMTTQVDDNSSLLSTQLGGGAEAISLMSTEMDFQPTFMSTDAVSTKSSIMSGGEEVSAFSTNETGEYTCGDCNITTSVESTQMKGGDNSLLTVDNSVTGTATLDDYTVNIDPSNNGNNSNDNSTFVSLYQ